MKQTWPQVQLALDLLRLEDALRIARAAVAQGIGWLEAGTPLIKSEGMRAVRSLSRAFPKQTVVADMKTLDAGAVETEMALRAGAKVVSISGLAHNRTVRNSVRTAARFDGILMADLLMSPDPRRRALELESLGVDIVCVHTGVDVQKALHSRLRVSRSLVDITRAIRIPVAAAGGVDPTTAGTLVRSGVSVVIVGGWITGSRDPGRASAQIMQKLSEVP
jgi:3-hexulose-6-phosphate synthase/6-phospho-3-hexuloisomerase